MFEILKIGGPYPAAIRTAVRVCGVSAVRTTPPRAPVRTTVAANEMQIAFEGKKRFIKGGYRFIADTLRAVRPEDLPLEAVILSDKGYYFEGTIDTNVDYSYDD